MTKLSEKNHDCFMSCRKYFKFGYGACIDCNKASDQIKNKTKQLDKKRKNIRRMCQRVFGRSNYMGVNK